MAWFASWSGYWVDFLIVARGCNGDVACRPHRVRYSYELDGASFGCLLDQVDVR